MLADGCFVSGLLSTYFFFIFSSCCSFFLYKTMVKSMALLHRILHKKLLLPIPVGPDRHGAGFTGIWIKATLIYLSLTTRNSRIRKGAAVAQWKPTGLQVNRSSERSCTWGMIHIKNHLISLDCPSIAIFTVQKCGIKHHSFIHSFFHSYICNEYHSRFDTMTLSFMFLDPLVCPTTVFLVRYSLYEWMNEVF